MTEYNIELKRFNGYDYDTLYPIVSISSVIGLEDSITSAIENKTIYMQNSAVTAVDNASANYIPAAVTTAVDNASVNYIPAAVTTAVDNASANYIPAAVTTAVDNASTGYYIPRITGTVTIQTGDWEYNTTGEYYEYSISKSGVKSSDHIFLTYMPGDYPIAGEFEEYKQISFAVPYTDIINFICKIVKPNKDITIFYYC